MSVPVAMIAAVATNGVIGLRDTLPWRLPSDFAFFKRMTLGKPLVMGRLTFEMAATDWWPPWNRELEILILNRQANSP